MFQGFSGATVDFMWGIRFNNEKGWFEAHKEEYLTTFQRPMKALADEVYVAFTDRHPDLDLICKVSRIYRDARRLFGRGPYKDHLWLSLTRPHEEGCAEPVFWFELGPEGYSYGMGFWQAPAHQLILTAGCLVLMSAAITGLLVLFSLSFTNRAVTAVEAVLLATALLMTASLLYNRLSEPEINSASVVVHENGQMEQLPPAPNPYYLDGWQREAALWFLDVFPTGQTLYLAADGALPHPARSAAASVALVTLSGLTGAAIFVKKDLK